MASYLLMALERRAPLVLVILVGIIIAIARWKRHPKASFLTLLGLGFYLPKLFLFTILTYLIPTVGESMHWSIAAANNLYIVLDVVNDIGFSIVLVLIVAAAFANRQPTTAANY